MLFGPDVIIVGVVLGLILTAIFIAIMLEAKCVTRCIAVSTLCFLVGAIVFSDKSWLYGVPKRIDGVTQVYSDGSFEMFNEETKELATYHFKPMGLRHGFRYFYDVPKDEEQYVTYLSGALAYGDVRFHLHEEELEQESNTTEPQETNESE